MTDTPTLEETVEAAPEVDATPKDTPPGKSRRTRATRTARAATGDKPAPRPKAAGRRKAKVDIRSSMTQLYVSVGMGLSMLPSKPGPLGVPATAAIGQTIAEQATVSADAWAKLADENPAVREALEKILTVSSVGALLAAHMPIVVVAAVSYGVVPAGVLAMFSGAPAPAPAPQPSPEPQQATA